MGINYSASIAMKNKAIKNLIVLVVMFLTSYTLAYDTNEDNAVISPASASKLTTAPNLDIEIQTATEVKAYQITMDDTYYFLLNDAYPWEVCNLSFYSQRQRKEVTPPQWFRETLYKYRDCNDQLLLTKIAHYESDFNPNSVNLSNTYARGLYHVLPSTRGECAGKYGIIEENDCALWVIKNYPEWYLTGYRPFNYHLSF